MSYDEHLISMAGGDGEQDTGAVAFHKLSKPQLLTLAIALQDQRDSALAIVREQAAKLDAVRAIIDEEYRLWAAVCGNTCSKDILNVDHDAIAKEVSALFLQALDPTP